MAQATNSRFWTDIAEEGRTFEPSETKLYRKLTLPLVLACRFVARGHSWAQATKLVHPEAGQRLLEDRMLSYRYHKFSEQAVTMEIEYLKRSKAA